MRKASAWLIPVFLGLTYLFPQTSAETWGYKVAFVASGLAVLAFISFSVPGRKPENGLLLPVLLSFSAWAFVSLLWSGNVPRHLSEAILICLCVLCALGGRLRPAPTHIAIAVSAIAALEILRVSATLESPHLQFAQRISGSFVSASHYSAFLLTAYGIVLAYALRRRGKPAFLLHLFAAVILASAALSKSRAVIPVTGSVLLAVFLCGAARMRRTQYLGALAAAIAIILSPVGIFDRISSQVSGGEPMAFARVGIWSAALRIVREHPAGGVGLGAFGDAFNSVRPEKYSAMTSDYAHNELLQVACELGLLGFGLAILGIGGMFSRILRCLDSRAEGFPLAMGLTAIAVSTLVDFTLHVPVIALTALFLYISASSSLLRRGVPALPPPNPAFRISLAVLLAVFVSWSVLSAASQAAYARGVAAFSAGKSEEAARRFRESVRLSRNPEALVAVAAVEGDSRKRISLLNEAIRLRRGWVNPRGDLFETYLAEGKTAKAAQILDEAASLDPHGLALRILRIRLAIHQGRVNEAAAELAEASMKWPNNIDLMFEEVRIAQTRGDLARARLILERILAARPGARYAQIWLNSIKSPGTGNGGFDE